MFLIFFFFSPLLVYKPTHLDANECHQETSERLEIVVDILNSSTSFSKNFIDPSCALTSLLPSTVIESDVKASGLL